QGASNERLRINQLVEFPQQFGEVFEARGNIRMVRIKEAFPNAQSFGQCRVCEWIIGGAECCLAQTIQVSRSKKRFPWGHQTCRFLKMFCRGSVAQLSHI